MSKPADADTKPNAVFHHTEHSDTAATVGNRIFPTGGEQTYRVTMANGAALSFVDVKATGGDDAAEKALEQHPGLKVAHVEPAPRQAKAA